MCALSNSFVCCTQGACWCLFLRIPSLDVRYFLLALLIDGYLDEVEVDSPDAECSNAGVLMVIAESHGIYFLNLWTQHEALWCLL